MSPGIRRISKKTNAAAPTSVGITSRIRFTMYRYIALFLSSPQKISIYPFVVPAKAGTHGTASSEFSRVRDAARWTPALRRGDEWVGSLGGSFYVSTSLLLVEPHRGKVMLEVVDRAVFTHLEV